jgi:hypothetical protein
MPTYAYMYWFWLGYLKFSKGMKSYEHALSHILFATVPVSRTNAYAQTGLMHYFEPADCTIAQLTIIITYESYLT